MDFCATWLNRTPGQLPDVRIVGIAGPRGDAYQLNRTITADSAEEYHSVQLTTLKRADVDLVVGMTFNSVPEAVGIARAAHRIALPLSVSFTLDSTARLKSGPTLREAIEAVDAQAGDARPDFYGINCSHPVEFAPALEPGSWFERGRCLRPNAATMDKLSLCQLGHLEEGDPVEMGQMMGDLAGRYPHLDSCGGCCGTWETHLDQIARGVLAVRARRQQPVG